MENIQTRQATNSHNFSFWFHLFITILAWVGPFLFSWYLMIFAYTIVILQFLVFKKCLLNKHHHLQDEDDNTFYSYLFEQIGISVNRSRLKRFVRRYVYLLLAAFTILWQIIAGVEPLLF